MPNSRTNKADKNSEQCSAVDKNKAGRCLRQCDGVQLSLKAVRWQLADINRKFIPQAHCTRKEGMTECVGSALDMPISGFGSSVENGSWLKVS